MFPSHIADCPSVTWPMLIDIPLWQKVKGQGHEVKVRRCCYEKCLSARCGDADNDWRRSRRKQTAMAKWKYLTV